MTPISIRELNSIVQGNLLHGTTNGIVRGVSIDTRTLVPDDLFIAFTGAQVDGHKFIQQAIQKGASAILVTHPVPVQNDSVAIIQVDDALTAIQQLAKHERSQFAGPVVAVTGSNGKTTTKEMLAAVFRAAGNCLFTAGNHNNELGLPLTILQRNASHGAIILEMGMRGLGQIRELCQIAQPTAGIITNIGQSHIELLGSEEGIANAKAELLDALPATGVCVLPLDDPWSDYLQQRFVGNPLWYSTERATDAFATDVQLTHDGTRFQAHVLGQSVTIQLPTYGIHNVRNALGAILIGAAYGIPLNDMALQLVSVTSISGRLHIVEGQQGRRIIDDCYNASPLSMKASLDVLSDLANANHLHTAAIVGDMYELGDFSEDGHREVGRYAINRGIQTLITIGPQANWVAEEASQRGMKDVHSFDTVAQACSHLQELLPSDSVVLVKASRGMALETVVAQLVGNGTDFTHK